MRAAKPRKSLAVYWVLWHLCQVTCRAQSLTDLMVYGATSTVDNLSNIPTATNAAINLLPHLLSPDTPTYNVLPRCQSTNVLLKKGGFPMAWDALSAQQQITHPINLVMMQLAYAAYQPADTFKGCLTAMGIDPNSIKAVTTDVPRYSTSRSALVMRAGNERIFITIMGSNFQNGQDLAINLDCRQTFVNAITFGARGKQIGLHTGFWTGWQALEKGVVETAARLLKDVPTGEVYVIGHSLGAAIASIAALRLNILLPKAAHIRGVWLFGSPRVGGPEWAEAYDAVLLSKTLRISNFQDFAVRLPGHTQMCAVGGSINPLTLEAYTINQQVPFEFRHIGRHVLMCPNTQTGLTNWKLYPGGSETLDCGLKNGLWSSTADEADYSGGTHVLGAYFDAWKRGYFAYRHSTLATDPRLNAVMCGQCVATEDNIIYQMNVPARPGGPVTCSIDENCNKQDAFAAATAVGRGYSKRWGGSSSICKAYRCA